MKFIIANWKENPQTLDTAKQLIKITQNNKLYNIEVTHAVPNIFAGILKQEDKNANVILQNISKFKEGSHTGEISVAQAKNLNIQMSIVGHSETRLSPDNPHGDEDKDVNEKIKNLVSENMWACLCVGEYERSGNFDYKNFILNQIKNCLASLSQNDLQKIVLAYEPIWAIGANAKRAATIEEIVEVINFIKENFPGMKVLYGGSVDEKNALEIMSLNCVDGLLVGRASSDPEKWESLLKSLI
jgi:triosephosphate isomerase